MFEMDKKFIRLFSLVALLTLPVVVFAVDNPSLPGTVGAPIDAINRLLNFIWPIFIGFAVIMFIVSGFLFLSANGDPGKISTARHAVLWGIVGVIIGILAFSIPYIIQRTIVP